MNSYAIIDKLLKSGDSAALFPPLSEEGHSLALFAHDALLYLTTDPEDEESRHFALSSPLLSLSGADDATQMAFLWNMAKAQTPSALPPGYFLYADWEDLSVSLGGQFLAEGLELGTLETIADEFYRVSQVLKAKFQELLTTLAENGPAATVAMEAGTPAGTPFFGDALRV